VKPAHSYSQQLRLFGLLNCYIWNRPNFTDMDRHESS